MNDPRYKLEIGLVCLFLTIHNNISQTGMALIKKYFKDYFEWT